MKTTKDSLGVESTTYDYSVRVRPNQELAKNYKHGLLLFTGAMDKTVNPAHTLRLADALIKADKDFDLFVLPKCTHGFFGESEEFLNIRCGVILPVCCYMIIRLILMLI